MLDIPAWHLGRQPGTHTLMRTRTHATPHGVGAGNEEMGSLLPAAAAVAAAMNATAATAAGNIRSEHFLEGISYTKPWSSEEKYLYGSELKDAAAAAGEEEGGGGLGGNIKIDMSSIGAMEVHHEREQEGSGDEGESVAMLGGHRRSSVDAGGSRGRKGR